MEAEIIFKEAVITTLVAKIIFVVAAITFNVAVSSSVAKIIFEVADITLKWFQWLTSVC